MPQGYRNYDFDPPPPPPRPRQETFSPPPPHRPVQNEMRLLIGVAIAVAVVVFLLHPVIWPDSQPSERWGDRPELQRYERYEWDNHAGIVPYGHRSRRD